MAGSAAHPRAHRRVVRAAEEFAELITMLVENDADPKARGVR